MKGMKGKMMKKLKSVKHIGYLQTDRLLQVTAFDGFVENFPLKSAFVDKIPFNPHKIFHSNQPKQKPNLNPNPNPNCEEPQKINVDELIKDLEEEDFESESHIDDKENTRPSISEDPIASVSKTETTLEDVRLTSSNSTELNQIPLSEIDISSFRRPDMNSGSLFDPNLLAVFEQAVTEHIRSWEEAQLIPRNQNHNYPFFIVEDQNDPLLEFDNQTDPLTEFEEKCPPGGSDSVIFYTTSLRGIRKTFEDCQSIRFLLESFRLIYCERDVSIHSEFRDELWRIMGEKLVPPRLFIKGRYIGGAEKVLGLNEQGKLRPLFRDIPINFNEGSCHICSGLRFILCFNCNGSRKVFNHDEQGGGDNNGGLWSKCPQCNENGLIVCPLCC